MHLMKIFRVASAVSLGLLATNFGKQDFSTCHEIKSCYTGVKENSFQIPTIEFPKLLALDLAKVHRVQKLNKTVEESLQQLTNDLSFGDYQKKSKNEHRLEYGDFLVYYDTEKMNPIFVYEFLTEDKLQKKKEFRFPAKFDWQEDDRMNGFDLRFEPSQLGDGLSRGHMAAKGNHVSSAEDHAQTFFQTNFSPQNCKLNSGLWGDLETFCRELVKDNVCEGLHVFTGPAWDEPTSRAKRVPTHFFKIIMYKSQNGEYRMSCFLVPNKDGAGSSFKNYVVTLDRVMSVTGLNFKVKKEEWPLVPIPKLLNVEKDISCTNHEPKVIQRKGGAEIRWERWEKERVQKYIEEKRQREERELRDAEKRQSEECRRKFEEARGPKCGDHCGYNTWGRF